jgi:hypothetical protein
LAYTAQRQDFTKSITKLSGKAQSCGVALTSGAVLPNEPLNLTYAAQRVDFNTPVM